MQSPVHKCHQCRLRKIECNRSTGEASCEACQVRGSQCEGLSSPVEGKASPTEVNRPLPACFFCRGRKIACTGGPGPDDPNRTCNQCSRRQLKCEVPKKSKRGLRKARLSTPTPEKEEKHKMNKENVDSEDVWFPMRPGGLVDALGHTALSSGRGFGGAAVEDLLKSDYSSAPDTDISMASTSNSIFNEFLHPQALEFFPRDLSNRHETRSNGKMQPAEDIEESRLIARSILPTDVHRHLVYHQDEIVALVAQQGRIDAYKITLSAGFDEDMMASEEVPAQRAYISCSRDLHMTTEKTDTFLLALGNILAPFAATVETPSQKFHSLSIPNAPGVRVVMSEDSPSSGSLYPTNIDPPRDDDDAQGDGQESRRNEGNDDIMESSSSDSDGVNPDAPDSDSGLEESAESSTTVASERSGGGQNDGGDPSDPGSSESCDSGACARFDITFNIKPSLSYVDVHRVRVKGSVEAKRPGSNSHTSPDAIATSQLQFTQLDFHPTSQIAQGPKKVTYNQFYARVDMELPFEWPIYLHDIFPKSSQCIVDGKRKVSEAKEHADGRQISGSAKIDFPILLPFAPTISPSLSISNTQAMKTGRTRECMQTVGRVQQVDTRRGLRWGYHVEDDWVRQNGLKLTDTPSLCPSAKFDFLGKEAGLPCPNRLQVTVRSYWSLGKIVDRMPEATFFWRREIHFRNLGVQVTFDVPPHLKKSWAVHRDVDVWIGRDATGAMGGRVKDNYTYGYHSVTATPFYVLSDRECLDPDISEP